MLRALQDRCVFGRLFMAEEFRKENTQAVQETFAEAIGDLPTVYEPHDAFKKRVPHAIGLIRTGDTTPYANMILESA